MIKKDGKMKLATNHSYFRNGSLLNRCNLKKLRILVAELIYCKKKRRQKHYAF